MLTTFQRDTYPFLIRCLFVCFSVIARFFIGMANNLNQLTKLSHQRGFHETHAYVVDLLRRLKAILGEYGQASYKPKPSRMGRKEDTT